jgi:cobalamin-dependent methionine synthase I
LGYNVHLTEISPQQKNKIENSINYAFSICESKGAWYITKIRNRTDDYIEIFDDIIIKSKSLAKLLSNSHSILFMGTTVGSDILEIISEELENSNSSTALIYDAVGSETADSAMDWLNNYVGQSLTRNNEKLTKRRFSPGYGDLKLENQKIIYDLLNLKQFEIELTDRFILKPEKSVTAIAGVE